MGEINHEMRRSAERDSALPAAFKTKIIAAFWGKKCPVCGVVMNNIIDKDLKIFGNDFVPTIQHNVPLSKGGKHELGNISVICKRCNVSIRDTETGELNSKEVVNIWNELTSKKGC